MQVLERIANGFSTSEIAEQLGSKPKTIENHRYSIAKKLRISGKNCVLKYAIEHKSELQPD